MPSSRTGEGSGGVQADLEEYDRGGPVEYADKKAAAGC